MKLHQLKEIGMARGNQQDSDNQQRVALALIFSYSKPNTRLIENKAALIHFE